jgi:hypothetical protein
MDIGIFPWISAFCMVCFFPTWFWDRASTLRSALLRRIELARRLQLATVRLGDALVAFSRAVVSFLMEARQLLFAGPVPPLAAGAVGTSDTRYDESLSEDPEPAELRSSLAANLLAFFFIFYILCWNLTTVTSFALPERTVPLGPFLGLDQYWGMFAPSPSNEDGWYVIPGELRDGEKVDLMPITRDDYTLHPVSYEKPQDIPATYKNEHWRKYLENIYNRDHAGQRLYFGQYICRQWNSHHEGADTLETFRIIYMLELTLPDYRQSEPEKVELWDHTC